MGVCREQNISFFFFRIVLSTHKVILLKTHTANALISKQKFSCSQFSKKTKNFSFYMSFRKFVCLFCVCGQRKTARAFKLYMYCIAPAVFVVQKTKKKKIIFIVQLSEMKNNFELIFDGDFAVKQLFNIVSTGVKVGQ